MASKAKTESSVEPELEAEVKDEPGSPDSSKQSQKKKKSATTRRRTKTGCLTCRQRRVKCDEMKPTCKNCEKSRRTCAGYQIPQIRTPSVSDPYFVPQPHPSPPFDGPHSAMDHMATRYASTTVPTPEYAHQLTPDEYSTTYVPTTQPQAYGYPIVDANVSTTYTPYPPSHNWQPPPIHASQAYAYNTHHPFSFDSSSRGSHTQAGSSRTTQQATRPLHVSQSKHTHEPMRLVQSQYSYSERFENDPNDPWDVDSDEEINEDFSLIGNQIPRAVILDERMAYLLTHFVTILRPCMSIHERPVMFDGTSTFAEKLPTLALSNRGLLHGLLAVSSLQLAIIHHTSEAIPLKHFVIASKKLAKLISTPSSRHKLETLGLCLILAFYEVLLSDHARWVLHLRGAAAFVMEHDYAGFIRSVRSIRAREKARQVQSSLAQKHDQAARIPPALTSDAEWEIDDQLIRGITGLNTDFAHQRQPSAKHLVTEHNLTEDIVQEWRTKLDLLWWYVKMDVFQSILSGDPLLLPFRDWKFLHPRGRIGSTANLHATMDHLWLILGRLADFGAKDRSRKLRKMAATGGFWVPEPGFMSAPATSSEAYNADNRVNPQKPASQTGDPRANEGRTRAPQAAPQLSKAKKPPPLFFGMMPPPKIPPSMLSSFHITDTALCAGKSPSPPDADLIDPDLTNATEAALKEHDAITAAFSIWINALGPDFAALPPRPNNDHHLFGAIRHYSDPVLACIWSLYHLGKILLRRYHPYSPPAMMMSASVNRAFTKPDAEAIGSINMGLLERQAELASAGSINPTLVAALQELSFPVMFAAVQFEQAAQRTWVLDSLLDLAKYSGWRTSFSIASGLEAAWQAQGGYRRTLSSRTPYDMTGPNQKSSSGELNQTPEEEHRSRFVNHDRRLIDRFSDLRAFWAIGLLSTQEDLEGIMHRLDINKPT